jgi:AbrB family looped-hinge helix DNA binding protein
LRHRTTGDIGQSGESIACLLAHPDRRAHAGSLHQRRPIGLHEPRQAAAVSSKNQVTIPVAARQEVGLHAGEQVTVEPAGDGELRIRRATITFEDAFGALTGTYPAGYLDQLDAEDEDR